MVYRIQPKRHSMARHFAASFTRILVLTLLVSFAMAYFLELQEDVAFLLTVLAISAPVAALLAWLNVRAWKRLDWFTPMPQEYFLTMVDEGLIIESNARGFASYIPWKGFSFRYRGGVLMLCHMGVLRSIASLHGLPKERQEEILSTLRRYSGGEAVHGTFSPQQAAAPFARAAAVELPPLPVVTLPPPVPVAATTEAVYSNSPEQWQEYVRLVQRPGKLACGLLLASVSVAGFFSAFDATLEGSLLSGAFFFGLAAYFVYRLGRPGRRGLPRIPGALRLTFTRNEQFEQTEQGAWGRYRLPEAAGSRLIRLPHSYCLLKENGLPGFIMDAAGELPAELSRYTAEPAPRNGLRALAALLLLALGLLAGHLLAGEAQDAPCCEDCCELEPWDEEAP